MQDNNLKTKESQEVKKRVTKPLVIPNNKDNNHERGKVRTGQKDIKPL